MTTFAEVLPVKQIESHKYEVNFTHPWCIGKVPNGGYVTSAFMLVASTHMQLTHSKGKQKDVINLHLEFMRKTSEGQAFFTVKDAKIGARVSNLRLILSQKDDRTGKLVDEVEGYVTMTNMSSEAGLSLDTGFKLHPEPLSVDLVNLSQNKDKNFLRRGRDPLADFRRAGTNMAMHLMRPEKRPAHFPKALIDQWITFKPEGKKGVHTNDALGFVVDIFPQLIEGYVNADLEEAVLQRDMSPEEAQQLIKSRKRQGFWYPTLSLNLDVKKLLPAEGVNWLFVRIQATSIFNGRFDLSVHVLDEQNDLVALSTHACLAVDASRNMERSKSSASAKL